MEKNFEKRAKALEKKIWGKNNLIYLLLMLCIGLFWLSVAQKAKIEVMREFIEVSSQQELDELPWELVEGVSLYGRKGFKLINAHGIEKHYPGDPEHWYINYEVGSAYKY